MIFIQTLRCLILGLVTGVRAFHRHLLDQVESVGCPQFTVLNESLSVTLFAGGLPSLSTLASNITCTWIIPSKNRASLGFSFFRLPAGANLTVEVYPVGVGDMQFPGSHCNCDNTVAPVCDNASIYLNNCTALCAGAVISELCTSHARTVLQGDLPLPFTTKTVGGAVLIRYMYVTLDRSVGIQPFVQLGFNLTKVDPSSCFNHCSQHGECIDHPSGLGMPTCDCEAEWKGADCSLYVPFIHDQGSMNVTALCPGCWVFAQFMVANASFIKIEVDSFTEADSDPFLVVRKSIMPSLTRFDRSQSWVSWTRDDSQMRLITWDGITPSPTPDGPYYVGVVNHPLRAKQAIDLVLTLQLGNSSYLPCLHNCSGVGLCDTSVGACSCNTGTTGVYCEQPDTEIRLGFFKGTQSVLRMGQWAFWHFDIVPELAFSANVMVSLESLSPRAYSFLGVRRHFPPSLDSRFLPTFDAFQADFADNPGFDLLRGQRQTVIVPASMLTPGRYFVGVFNLWGNTGLPQTSYTTMNYTLFVDLVPHVIPCPLANPAVFRKNTFCGEIKIGSKCNSSRGVCRCDINELGQGCQTRALPLPVGKNVTRTVPAGTAAYYYLVVNQSSDLNLKVTATRLDNGNSSLLLLARKGAQPFDVNFTYYDLRDPQSTAATPRHSLTLSHHELTAGVWYFAVINSPENSDPLQYVMEAVLAANVSCVSGLSLANVESECSDQGTCEFSDGTCKCNQGFAGTDCSAFGIPYLGTGGQTKTQQTPVIPVGKWGYWSFALPCRGLQFLVQLQANMSDNPGAAPLLVIRNGSLPMQLDGTFTLVDYYNGLTNHKLPQAIHLSACIGGKCMVNPLYDDSLNIVGTDQNIGWEVVPSGIYFVGVYNDPSLATGPLQHYDINVKILDDCKEECGDGFVGAECEEVCPGMIPSEGVPQGLPCSGRGICYSVSTFRDTHALPKCVCDQNYAGLACELECRNEKQELGCTGHGRCVADRTGVPYCMCDSQYRGSDCSQKCPGVSDNSSACHGRGECVIDANGVRCKCDLGFGGHSCELECPDQCHHAGECLILEEAAPLMAVPPPPPHMQCRCRSGHVGPTCGISCPLGVNNLSCSGWGSCAENKGRATCLCHACCEGPVCSIQRVNQDSSFSVLTGLGVLAACLICAVVILVCCCCYRKRVSKSSELEPVPLSRSDSQKTIIDQNKSTSTTSIPLPTSKRSRPKLEINTEKPLGPEDEVLVPGGLSNVPQTPPVPPDFVSFHLESLKTER